MARFRPLGSAGHAAQCDAWWWVMDSNHRRRKPADLQSALVGHLSNPPYAEGKTSRVTARSSSDFLTKLLAGRSRLSEHCTGRGARPAATCAPSLARGPNHGWRRPAWFFNSRLVVTPCSFSLGLVWFWKAFAGICQSDAHESLENR